MKRTVNFLLKLFGSLLLTVILLEGGLRLFPAMIPLDFLVHFNRQPRAQIAWQRGLPTRWDMDLLERDDGGPEFGVFKPGTRLVWPIQDDGTTNTVVMDEIGFCNPSENSYHRQQIDIITLGDSFTICHAVAPDETWTAHLGRLSGEAVYNLGKGGIGVHEYLQILKQFGLPKSPRLVIMNVYGGNDLRDAIRYYQYRTGEAPVLPPPNSESWLARHSYAYNLFRAMTVYNSQEADSDDDESDGYEKYNFRYRVHFPDGRVERYNPLNTDTDEVKYAQQLNLLEIETGGFAAIEEAMGNYVTLAQEYGFVPVVSYTPSAHVTYADFVIFDDNTIQELMPWFDRQQRTYLAELAQQYGFYFIDLTPALQAAAQANRGDELLYYRYDLHLTPTGHQVVGRAVYAGLRQLELLEGEE